MRLYSTLSYFCWKVRWNRLSFRTFPLSQPVLHATSLTGCSICCLVWYLIAAPSSTTFLEGKQHRAIFKIYVSFPSQFSFATLIVYCFGFACSRFADMAQRFKVAGILSPYPSLKKAHELLCSPQSCCRHLTPKLGSSLYFPSVSQSLIESVQHF